MGKPGRLHPSEVVSTWDGGDVVSTWDGGDVISRALHLHGLLPPSP